RSCNFDRAANGLVQIYEDKILPNVQPNRHKSIRCAIEIAYAVELHHAFERAINSVSPAVVRAPELFGAARSLRHDCCCMMAAYIIESAQLPIVAAHDHDRLARHVCGEELTLLAKLVGASYDLPGGAKHAA